MLCSGRAISQCYLSYEKTALSSSLNADSCPTSIAGTCLLLKHVEISLDPGEIIRLMDATVSFMLQRGLEDDDQESYSNLYEYLSGCLYGCLED